MFPVIEHKTLSTAQKIIGPKCNTASKAQKKIFSSRSLSLSPPPFLFVASPSFHFLHFQTSLFVTAIFHSITYSTVVSSNNSAATAAPFSSQQNDSLTCDVVLKVFGDILKCERLPDAAITLAYI